jgi:hypothetical protein
MKRFRGCLMVAFIFGSGLLVGGFLGAALGWVGFFHKVVRGGPGAVAEIFMDRAAHDLKLRPEQRPRVKAIIGEAGTELRAATLEIAPQVGEIVGRNADRLRAELTPEQRRKFDRFAAQARLRWLAQVQARRTAPAPAPAPTQGPVSPPAVVPAPPAFSTGEK